MHFGIQNAITVGINPKSFGNKLKITAQLNEVLEKMIARNPGQWIWTHNRWK